MDINIRVAGLSVSPIGYKEISIDLSGVEISEIISEIGEKNILDEIGRDRVIEHFGIIEIE